MVDETRDISIIWFLLEDDIVVGVSLRGGILRRHLQLLAGGSLGTNANLRIGIRQYWARFLNVLSPASFPGSRRTPADFDCVLHHRRLLRTAGRAHDRVPQEVVEADLTSVA